MKSTAFKDISDTARLVAHLRALESDRADAHFKDPYAKILAGDVGTIMELHYRNKRFDARMMAVRTRVLDEQILGLIEREGIDTVLNLAAGLDTRPYRLSLPASLKWIEVDFAPILSYKEKHLAGETPSCQLEVVKMDLTHLQERRQLFTRINTNAWKVLVLTEGLLMYLRPEQVAALAEDLRRPRFQFWLMDLLSPSQLRWLIRKWGKQFSDAKALPHFAPEEGADYFRNYGWDLVEQRSFISESQRLNREHTIMKVARWLSPLFPQKWRAQQLRRYGSVLLSQAKDS